MIWRLLLNLKNIDNSAGVAEITHNLLIKNYNFV